MRLGAAGQDLQGPCLVEQEVDGSWTGGAGASGLMSDRHQRRIQASASVPVTRPERFRETKLFQAPGQGSGVPVPERFVHNATPGGKG
jgi:hypothetical protein